MSNINNQESFIKNRRTGSAKTASGFSEGQEYEDNSKTETEESEQKIGSLDVDIKKKKQIEENYKTNFYFNLNEIICIVNILASAFGVGAFTFPYILYEIGVINSLFIFIILSISVYFSLDLLRRFVVDSHLFSYSSITKKTLGNCWLKIYAISTFLFYISNIINYLNIIYNLAKSMMNFLDDLFPKISYFIITFSIELLLCIFTSNISKIYIFSFIGVVGFIIVFFIVIIKGIIVLSTDDERFKYFYFFSFQNTSSPWEKFLALMAKTIEFFYGYIYHSTFPTLLSELKNLENENTKKIHNISFGIICTVYALFSFFGLFCIDSDNIDKNVLFVNGKDLKDNNPLICIFKSILILLFLALIPVRYLIIRDNYTSIIGKEFLPKKIEIIITSICLFITNLFVYFANFDNLISNLILIFGGFFGVFIGFVLPVINYISINGRTKNRAIIGYIIAGIFVVVGFFSIFYNFNQKEKIEPNITS